LSTPRYRPRLVSHYSSHWDAQCRGSFSTPERDGVNFADDQESALPSTEDAK